MVIRTINQWWGWSNYVTIMYTAKITQVTYSSDNWLWSQLEECPVQKWFALDPHLFLWCFSSSKRGPIIGMQLVSILLQFEYLLLKKLNNPGGKTLWVLVVALLVNTVYMTWQNKLWWHSFNWPFAESKEYKFVGVFHNQSYYLL